MKYDKKRNMLKKIKIFNFLLLTLFLILFDCPVFVFSASNNPGTLTITKSNGALAAEGTVGTPKDYYWEYDLSNSLHKLYITSENLTISGTDDSNNVWIVFDRSYINDENDDACASLTFNNLNLSGNVSIVINKLLTYLTIKGDNSITNNVDGTNVVSTNSGIDIIGNGNLTINSTGNDSCGIYNNSEDDSVELDLYGDLNINSTRNGIYSEGDIYVTNTTKKIIVRSGDGTSKFPLCSKSGINTNTDIKIYGSSDINAEEDNMLEARTYTVGEMRVIGIDGEGVVYPCSVVLKPKETLKTITFNLMSHGSQIDPIRVEVGEKITKPEDPVEDGHIFGGWCKEIACVNIWDFDNDIVTGSMTLYAKWNFEMLSDPDQSINVDSSNSNLVFRSNANFEDFIAVYVDDSSLVRDVDYLVEEGSTKVTLLSSFLKTLSKGQHVIEIESKINDDGFGGYDYESAIGTFTIIRNDPIQNNYEYIVPNTSVY